MANSVFKLEGLRKLDNPTDLLAVPSACYGTYSSDVANNPYGDNQGGGYYASFEGIIIAYSGWGNHFYVSGYWGTQKPWVQLF